jgi:cytochrome c
VFSQRKSQTYWAGFGAMAVLLASALLSTTGQAQTPGKVGKELFEKRCGGCHALDRDKEGPRLGGVYGRATGSIATFQYSDGLQKAKFTWTEEKLDQWLADPEKLVADNDMTFHVESADERRAIISYLKNSGK